MYKAGTVGELSAIQDKIPEEVYSAALSVVTMLDETFGEDRDVDNDDGGVVFIVENEGDLHGFSKQYVELDSALLEYVELVKAQGEPYLNAFFLYNEYEYGITLLIPVSIAPETLLRNVLHAVGKV